MDLLMGNLVYQENPDSSAVQSTPAAESLAIPLVQKSTQGVQGGKSC